MINVTCVISAVNFQVTKVAWVRLPSHSMKLVSFASSDLAGSLAVYRPQLAVLAVGTQRLPGYPEAASSLVADRLP